MTDTREQQLLQMFAQVTGNVVDGYDTVEMLQNVVDAGRDLLTMSEAGILLVAGNAELDLVASTSEDETLVELFLQAGENGPCLDSVRERRTVSVPDLGASDEWPAFRDQALAAGFRAMHCVPLRLSETSVGTFSLLARDAGEIDAADATAAQILADVAALAIVHERAVRENTIVVDQLENALRSRVVIEQAKGVVSHTLGVSIDDAFQVIRRYARNHRVGLGATAEQIVARKLSVTIDD